MTISRYDLPLDIIGIVGSLVGIGTIIGCGAFLSFYTLADALKSRDTTKCYFPWWIDSIQADWQWITFTSQAWLLLLLVPFAGIGWAFRYLGDWWRRRHHQLRRADESSEDVNASLLNSDDKSADASAEAMWSITARLALPVSPWRLWFSVVTSVIVCAFLHGNDIVMLLAFILVSYLLTRFVPRYRLGGRVNANVLLHWVYAFVWLVGTANAIPVLNFAYSWTLNGSGYALNAIGVNGILGVQFVYHFIMLRLISFNMDYNWALDACEASVSESATAEYVSRRHDSTSSMHAGSDSSASTRARRDAQPSGGGGAPTYYARQETDLPPDEYTLPAFVAYVLYLPIYVTGPVSSFNAFVSHLKVPQSRVPLSSLALHAGRLVVWFVIHSMTLCLLPLAQLPWFAPDIYDTLIAPHAWRVFFVTMFILVDNYVRLVVIFRFARLLAIVDGVDVPDDMLRCPFAQHSFTMFWRSWHSSLNVWILRYVYKPLGGNRRKALLLLPVFVFVGIWHVDYQLLAWSLANAVGFGVEVYALTLVEKYKITSRLAEAAGGTLALLGLVCANLFITGPVLATRLIGGMYFNTADWLSSLGVWAFCVLFFSCLILHSHTRDRLLLLRPPPDRTHPAHFLAIDPFSKKK